MPSVKIDDLSPTPFFARFLEGQHTELTPEQMKSLRGGMTVVTMAAPSDSDAAEVKPSQFPWLDLSQLPTFDPSQFPWDDRNPGPAGPCGPSKLVA